MPQTATHPHAKAEVRNPRIRGNPNGCKEVYETRGNPNCCLGTKSSSRPRKREWYRHRVQSLCLQELDNPSFQYHSIPVFLNAIGKVRINPDMGGNSEVTRAQIHPVWFASVLQSRVFRGTWPGVTVPKNCVQDPEWLLWSKHNYFRNFVGHNTVYTAHNWFLVSFVKYELDWKGCLRKENRRVSVLPRNRERSWKPANQIYISIKWVHSIAGWKLLCWN